MYLDTASTSYLSFGINQLHFIQRISVPRSLYHSFSCCNDTFSAPLVVRFVERSHFLTVCACSKLRAPCTLSHAHDRFTVYMYKPRYKLIVTLRASERRRPHLAPANIEDLGFVQLSPFSYKHLSIVPCAWFVGSIVLSGPNSKWSSLTMCRRCDSQRVSLELNIENRHRLVNALT